MVIEDDHATRAFLTEALQFEDYDVRAVSDGQEGLQLIDNFEPDLILLDMFVPKVNGTQFIAEYKQKSQHAPIIGLSSALFDAHQTPGLAYFVKKPFDIGELFHHISALTQ